MPELSDEAKAELQAAIAIVRSDKQYTMLRDLHGRSTTPEGGKGTGKKTPPADPANPPPAKPPVDPADPPKKRGLWSLGNDDDD